MIAQLKGILSYKSSTEIVVDCNGVGYSAFVSVNTSEDLSDVGSNVMVFTLLIPREDALQLYAFINEAEREAFKLLISVSGVGPKIAIGILSSIKVADLQEYIFTGNIHALQKMPGIGKKTAERLILELRDKVTKLGIYEQPKLGATINLIRQETLAALITLGYSQVIAEKAIRKAISDEPEAVMTAEKLIRKSLKYAMN